MLRKFRRNSKDASGNGSSSISPVETNTSDGTVETSLDESGGTRLSFFDLPAEIRNAIYEFVIADSTLSLPSSMLASAKKLSMPLKKRPKSLPTPINGLLIASKQCRREYLPMLFSCGFIAVEVKDFNFEGVMRASSALDEAEVQALLLNSNLTIQLVLQNCRPRDLNNLRKWLDYRKDYPIHLPWRYEFAPNTLPPPSANARFRLMRELACYYAYTINQLAPELHETQRAELQLIVNALRDKVKWLEESVGWTAAMSMRNYSRANRGLAGGGWV